MDHATKTTRTLDITGMSGETCVQKVTGALKGVAGVTMQSVKVGTATITADQAGTDAAVAAVVAGGYRAQSAPAASAPAGSTATPVTPSTPSTPTAPAAAKTPGSQTCMPEANSNKVTEVKDAAPVKLAGATT